MSRDNAASAHSALLGNVPLAFSVSCGSPSLEETTIANLEAHGLHFDLTAKIVLVLDAPSGYAVAEIERLAALDRRVVAMTWSPCPEYWADLGDLGAQILVVGQQPDDVLGAAVRHAAYGVRYAIAPEVPTPLTPSERYVLHLLARGCSNQEIAEHTSTRHQTVRNMLTTIYQKLDVTDRSAALLYYWGICPTVTHLRPVDDQPSEEQM